jgi:serine protease Do
MVRNTIGLVRSGGAVKLSVLRDGKPLHLEITTVDPQKIEAKIRASDKFLYGIGMLNFDQQVPMQGHVQGVLINHLSEDSPGWHSGLAPGDVIVSANQQPVHNIVELQAMAAKSKEHLLLNIHRVGGALFIAVKADPK